MEHFNIEGRFHSFRVSSERDFPSGFGRIDDDITPIPGPSESDNLSFEPGIRNDIFIQFRGTAEGHDHYLHDIDLLDDVGGLWRI